MITSIITGRTPKIAFQIAFAQGVRSPGNSRPILVVGGKSSAGTGTANTPTLLGSADDAATHFGRGTLAHLTCVAIFAQDPEALVDGCVAADSTATVATKDIVIGGGPATVAGTVSFCVGGQWAYVDVTVGMTDDQFGAAIVAAMGSSAIYPNVPVVATYNAGTNTITLTSKDKGTNAAAIKWDAFGVTTTGLTLDAYTGTLNTGGGANELDWSAALAAGFLADWYHFVVPTTNTRAPIVAATTGLKARVLAQAQPSVGKPISAILGANGSASDATGSGGTYAGSLDLDGGAVDPTTETGWWFQIGHLKSGPDPACVLAAAVCAARAAGSRTDRSARWCHPSSGKVLVGINPPHAAANYPSDAEIETCLSTGVSAIRVNRSTGNVELVWPVTCKHVTGGADDYRTSDTNVVDVCTYAAPLFAQRLADQEWEKLAADSADGAPPERLPATTCTPSMARELLKAIYYGPDLYGRGYVDLTYTNGSGATVSVDPLFAAAINGTDSGVLDCEAPCVVSRWLRSIGVRCLEYGRA